VSEYLVFRDESDELRLTDVRGCNYSVVQWLRKCVRCIQGGIVETTSCSSRI